jgi:outer membrane autotransporter protein
VYAAAIYSENTDISNSGTLEALDSSGSLNANNYAIYGDDTNVTNSAGGVLRGNLYVADLSNSGSIELPEATATVQGDFDQSATGTLRVSLSSDADVVEEYNIAYSKLDVSGTATLDAGTTIDVDVATASADQQLLIDQTLAGVIAARSIDADVDQLNITDNSFLLDFSAVLSTAEYTASYVGPGETLDLLIEKGMTVVEAAQQRGKDSVLGAAAALDALSDAGSDDAELNALLSAMYRMGTAAAVGQAVDEASPLIATEQSQVINALLSRISSIVQARQSGVRGFNSGDTVFADKNLWIKPFVSYAEQDDDGGNNGFDASSYGFGLGVDGEYAVGKRVGLAFFYSGSNVDINNVDQKSAVDTFNLLAYGSKPLIDDSSNLFYQLGGALHLTDSSRYEGSVDTTAEADYRATSLFAQVKGTREYPLNEELRSLLGLTLSYTYYNSPSYNESGAGGLNLEVSGFDSNSLVIEAQSDFIYALSETLELLGNFGVGYDLIDDDVVVHSSFQGESGFDFVTEATGNGPFVYSAGVGLAVKLDGDLSFDLKYDLDGRGSDYLNHSLSAKVNLKF